MRFMMLGRADKNTEAGVLPSEELVAAMGRFNEEMVKAGVLLAGEGIQPSSKGARVKFSRGAPTVTLAVIVLGFVGVVAMRPSEYRVARTATIAAPAPAVFAQVNDFHKWEAWNPWAKLDPAMKQAYEGAPAGIGAIYTWAGNSEVGEGRMTLTESRPSDLVRIRLEFLKPFATTSTAEFSFKPEGDHTAVTWSMTGKVNFMAKVVHLFMDMDRMIGGNFEKGLAQLKSVVEAAPKLR